MAGNKTLSCGVYVHVPYCRSICPYCDFNVVRQKNPPWPQFYAALVAEMEARAACLTGPLASVYFGGGTPSLAPAAWLVQVLAAVRARWPLQANAEVTLELEPATMGEAELATLRAAGFNRISMGWQSTSDKLLRTLGRGHTAAESLAALEAARAAGFANVSLDLIFAVPGQSAQDLACDLERVAQVQPNHVSLYNLTYHQGTPFARQKARGLLEVVGEAGEVEMLEQACVGLRRAGYARYEVSNFARPGMRAVHNAAYWQGRPYVGLGPGAHSFVRQGWERAWRWENVRRPQAYLALWGVKQKLAAARVAPSPKDPGNPERAELGRLVAAVAQADEVNFVEELDPAARMLERMLLGLRTTDGIDLHEPALVPFSQRVEQGAATLCARGWATQVGAQLLPTELGLRHADAAAALFA